MKMCVLWGTHISRLWILHLISAPPRTQHRNRDRKLTQFWQCFDMPSFRCVSQTIAKIWWVQTWEHFKRLLPPSSNGSTGTSYINHATENNNLRLVHTYINITILPQQLSKLPQHWLRISHSWSPINIAHSKKLWARAWIEIVSNWHYYEL